MSTTCIDAEMLIIILKIGWYYFQDHVTQLNNGLKTLLIA